MGKKVIFLDVDGVLNCFATFDNKNRRDDIDYNKVDMLRYLVGKTNAKIVLSSSWRNFFDDDFDFDFPNHKRAKELVFALRYFGLSIRGKTCIGENRGEEIMHYLLHHKDIESFVILDDEKHDFYSIDGLSNFLVQTSFENDGLTWVHVDKAIEMLETKINPFMKKESEEIK